MNASRILLFVLTVSLICSLQTKIDGQITVDYCSLFQQDADETSTVVSKAILYLPSQEAKVDGGEAFFFSKECNDRDYFGLANFRDDVVHRTFAEKLNVVLDRRTPIVVAVRFTGRLSVGLPASYGHLDTFRGLIEIDSLEYLDKLDPREIFPDIQRSAPRIDASKSLKALNTELISSILKNDDLDAEFNQLLSSTTKFVLNGEFVARSVLLRQVNGLGTEYMSERITDLERRGSIWTIRGVVKLAEGKLGSAEIIFHNSYVLNEDTDRWNLVNISLTGLGIAAS